MAAFEEGDLTNRGLDPLIKLDELLSRGLRYVDDDRYAYPLAKYNWSSDTLNQIVTLLQSLMVKDRRETNVETDVEIKLRDWADRITIPEESNTNKGAQYRWLTSEQGKAKIMEALVEVWPNVLTSKLDKLEKQMINILLDVKNGKEISQAMKVKRIQGFVRLLRETAKESQAKLDFFSVLIMGDPYGKRDIDVAVAITPQIAANYPDIKRAKAHIDMNYLTNLLLSHAAKYGVHDLPPVGASVVVVDKVNSRDVIIATSGGSPITTNNIIATTQNYFYQPSPLLNLDIIKIDLIPIMSYLLVWMAQKMKFLTPNIYYKHINDDTSMPTYRDAIQDIYDNPIARIEYSRSYVIPTLRINVEPSGEQWGMFKALAWKLSQIIIFPHGYYPHTRWDLRYYLNKLYGQEFSKYCSQAGMSDVNLGDAVVWYMCEGKPRKLSPLSNEEARAIMPAELKVNFNRYAIPFLLDTFGLMVDENMDAILRHTTIKAIPFILDTLASQYPAYQALVKDSRPQLDNLLGYLD